MASQLAAAPAAPAFDRARRPHRLIGRLVRRRVAISVALFAGLVLLDLLVFRNRPRDVLSLADPLVPLAEVLILVGLLIRSWAAGTLRKKKQLATSGPYAWIRNPLYAGSFLMMVGFGTLVQDPLTLWIVIGPLAWLYWQAVRTEERHMAEIFPTEWPQYAAAVPRFLPRRLAWPRAGEWSLAQWRHNLEYQAWIGSVAALVAIKVWLSAM
jgi:protein-S-isoprenylcysteine O-methyltransferase Ste14